MATLNKQLVAAAGFSFVTLSSWAGDAVFSVTPVAGDQIYFPNTLTVDSTGLISGAAGSYTIRKISANGSAQAITYTISASPSAGGASVNATLAAAAGFSYVTLTSWAGNAIFPSAPVAGDQIYYPDSLTVGTDGQVTGPSGNYNLIKIDDTASAESITYSTGSVPAGTVTIDSITVTSTTATVTFSYNNIDQTGFEYRLDGGAWASATSPQIITGLSLATSYTLGVRAINGSGGGSEATQGFTTSASSGSTTNRSFNAGVTYTTVTLGASPSQTHFGSFAVAPVQNDQITTLTADGTFDSSGSFSQTSGGDYTVYHTRFATGIISTETVTIAGVVVSDSTPQPGDTVTFTFGAKVGPFTATYKGQSVTIDSQTTSSITINSWPVLQTLGDSSADYNTAYDFVITDTSDASTETVSITTTPETNYDYHVVTGSPWATESIYDNDAGIADGHKHYGHFTSGSATTVQTDGIILGVTDRAVYEYWIYDGSNWGSSGTETFKVLGPLLTTALELVPSSETLSSVQLRFQADDSGNYRIVGVLQTDPAPSITQILAGLDASGLAAIGDSGLTAFTANTLTTDTITGLPEGSGLSFYIALEDANNRTRKDGPVNATTLTAGTPPTWASTVPDATYNDEDPVSINLSSYATDATGYAISGLSENSGLVLDPVTGIISGTVNLFDASGADGQTTSNLIIATAINSSGQAKTEFELSFYNRNLPTIVSQIPDQTWSELSNVLLNVTNYFSGATSYTLEIDNGSGYVSATATISTYGISFNTTSGGFDGSPNSTAIANSPLLFRVRGNNADGSGDWNAFTATVNNSIQAGLVSSLPNQTRLEGQSFSQLLNSYFVNVTGYAISGLPDGTGISFNTVTAELSGTPNSIDAATSPFDVVVTGLNVNGNVSGTLTFTVVALNAPVLVASFPDLTLDIGSSISITPGQYFTGEDSITVSGLPSGSGISFNGTTLSGTLNEVDRLNTPLVITVTAINSDGSRSDAFVINVTGSVLVTGAVSTPTIRTISVPSKRSLSPKVFTQDSVDRLDYAFDLISWLGSDTISSVEITEGNSVVDAGVKGSTSFNLFVTGGVVGEATRITAHVTTDQGREIDVSLYVAFVDM